MHYAQLLYDIRSEIVLFNILERLMLMQRLHFQFSRGWYLSHNLTGYSAKEINIGGLIVHKAPAV